MKILIVIISLVGMSYSTAVASDFRKLSWGMTINEVRKIETVTLQIDTGRGEATFTSNVSYEGIAVQLEYEFKIVNQDTLFVHAEYMNHSYKCKDHIDNFRLFEISRQKIANTYGQPMEDFILDPQTYYWSPFITWKTDRTIIDLALMRQVTDFTSFRLSYSRK